jgi:predicted AAA+ superfamily ATPase
MVSYFGSALGDVFRLASARALNNADEKITDVELKVRVSEILSLADAPEHQIGDLIILKDDISFQDMQSTHRAFKKYFDAHLETDGIVRNIIVAQACRHSIVHDGARVNQRTINQIRNASPRTLKPELTLNQEISFSIDEIDRLSVDMLSYVSKLVDKVR